MYRNDQLSVEEVSALQPSHLIISPGPCTPTEAGISVDVIKDMIGKVPILGVCLGHQSIGQATGANIVRAEHLMHGKTDEISHDDQGIFAGLPNPFTATRYHSLVIEPDSLSEEFDVSAWATAPNGNQEIMAIRHKTQPVIGLQFHPESFLSEIGVELLKRFISQ